jgi:hypothetical protein
MAGFSSGAELLESVPYVSGPNRLLRLWALLFSASENQDKTTEEKQNSTEEKKLVRGVSTTPDWPVKTPTVL